MIATNEKHTVAPPSPNLASAHWRARAGVFRELQDLKRQQPAHLSHSIATELFRRAWQRLLAGDDTTEVALDTTAAALTNVLFPGCDERFFPAAGFSESETAGLLAEALRTTVSYFYETRIVQHLRTATTRLAHYYHDPQNPAGESSPQLPACLETLCRQPRAGATRPGFARLVLVPPEMHSDHCLLTAVYAVLCADEYGADVGEAFLCGLAHHLHNALLPDCGFAGEILLGEHLDGVIARGREQALVQFPEALRQNTRRVLRYHETIDAPEGRAISAGDVLDRVLDVKWRTRAAAVTDADILGDLDLVHAGPLKDFQTDLLQRTALWG